MASPEFTKEQRILRMTKRVLTDVAKDTMTPPGMKHPLSENTIQAIRECLQLIASREAEILEAQGNPSRAKPRLAGQPRDHVVVTLKPKNKPKGDSEK
jgi:hypothetical protein